MDTGETRELSRYVLVKLGEDLYSDLWMACDVAGVWKEKFQRQESAIYTHRVYLGENHVAHVKVYTPSESKDDPEDNTTTCWGEAVIYTREKDPDTDEVDSFRTWQEVNVTTPIGNPIGRWDFFDLDGIDYTVVFDA